MQINRLFCSNYGNGQKEETTACCCTLNKVKKISIGVLALLCFLHFIFFPLATEYYNDECFLSAQKYQAVVHAVFTVAGLLIQHNQTFWLDYGTLLGYIRSGSILRYDSDADVGRMMLNGTKEAKFCRDFKKILQAHHMTLAENCTKIFYTSENGDVVHVDMFRWKISTTESANGSEIRSLTRIDGKEKHEKDKLLKYSKKMGAGSLPADLVLPVQTVKMMNKLVKVPKEPIDVIKVRYPLSYKIPFPYKWKCWLPWNFPKKVPDKSS
ncbi:DgyrCDS1890 [Dimorphilus gyrociliatus]|uniref:DgyrCDS1890 n=1 Tax=Dimorphilus gyrociliatus TaxID=2664684 RepID=A0A7I8VA08_9ANNE|nr:DgyrCDS1890 [Dimorphilus gyrociliatus]